MGEALRPLVRNRLVLFGTGLILLVVVLAVAADVVAPYDPTEMKVVDALKRPSAPHPFGTDRFGRDVLSRTIYGSRIALGVALAGDTAPDRKHVLDLRIAQAFAQDSLPDHSGCTEQDDLHRRPIKPCEPRTA